MRTAAGAILLCGGVALELIAVLGVCVLRDAFDRLHAVGVASYGALLISVAILIKQSFSLLGDKALLTGVLLLAFSPILTQTTARSLRIRLEGDWCGGERGESDSREASERD